MNNFEKALLKSLKNSLENMIKENKIDNSIIDRISEFRKNKGLKNLDHISSEDLLNRLNSELESLGKNEPIVESIKEKKPIKSSKKAKPKKTPSPKRAEVAKVDKEFEVKSSAVEKLAYVAWKNKYFETTEDNKWISTYDKEHGESDPKKYRTGDLKSTYDQYLLNKGDERYEE